VQRNLTIGVAGAGQVRFKTGNIDQWAVSSSNFLPLATNASDIGSPSLNVRTAYVKQYAMISSAANPTAADILASSFAVWKNTTSGVVALWVNDGGVMKSVALA